MDGDALGVHTKKQTGIAGMFAIALAGYFALAGTTIALTSNGRNHATVWPADALILALLLGAPRKHWPTLLAAGWIANLLANLVTRGWSLGIPLYGAINMAQVSCAAFLITRRSAQRRLLQDPKSAVEFLLFAGLVAPSLGALLGSLVSLGNYGEPFVPSYLRWFASNALGLLIGTPFLQALLDGSYRRCIADLDRRARIQAGSLMVLHLGVVLLVFGQSRLPMLFLPLTSLLVLAFRLGRLGTFAGVIAVAVGGAAAAYLGVGPMTIMHRGPFFEAIYFQVYTAIVLCTTLPVAATVFSRAEALKALAEHRQALQLILEHTPDAILSFDRAGICSWATGPLEDFTGMPPHAFVGLDIDEISERTSVELARLLKLADTEALVAPTHELVPRLKPERTLEALLGLVRQGGRATGAVITLRDISARKLREKAISMMAETDDLTRVLNRKGFRTRLNAAIEHQVRPLTMALIDVDQFKSINDTFGHPVGDRVLEAVAQRLDSGCRSSDCVGRLGGDEFAILFHCDVQTARSACERIAESLRRSPILDDGNLRLMASISCGLAELTVGMNRSDFFDAADAALYEVKRSGRDGVWAA